MHTTFFALSAALARSRKVGDRDGVERVWEREGASGHAHLAYVLGPSVGSARARTMLVLDGLEVRVWGERDDARVRGDGECADEEEADEDEELENSDTDEDDDSEEEDSEDESGDERGYASDSDSASEPPPSRTPSPSPPIPGSSPPSPSRLPLPKSPLRPTEAHTTARQQPPQSQMDTQTYAEEQQALRAAERLLSRTLLHASAEESGGMSCELAPTQMHVLLRAPRRFKHPAWIPRQNLTRTLDSTLQTFLEEAWPADSPSTGESERKPKPIKRGARTEGVWVGCRDCDVRASMRIDQPLEGNEEAGVDEEDEMIWWVWDGKITGFSDW